MSKSTCSSPYIMLQRSRYAASMLSAVMLSISLPLRSAPAPLIQPFTYRSWASLKLSRMAAFLVFLRCIASTSAGVRSRLASRCTKSIAECSSSIGDVGGDKTFDCGTTRVTHIFIEKEGRTYIHEWFLKSQKAPATNMMSARGKWEQNKVGERLLDRHTRAVDTAHAWSRQSELCQEDEL